MDKLLTIIVPTYNAAAYLDKGLSSFAIKDEALFARLEVLIINDGSTDDSVKIAQPLAYGHNYDLAEVMDQCSQCNMDSP